MDRIPHLRVFESAFKLEWMEDPWRDVERAGEWLLRLEDRIGPDLVHLNGFAHGSLPWNAPKILVGHSCVLSWWRAVKGSAAPESWGRAAIYCLPARYEPFGLSGLEAALSGCTLVLGDIPSLREIWRHRAVFVPPDDPEALEDALSRLIADPDRRASLAAGCRARALQLTPERMVEAYLAAYGEVLAERGAVLEEAVSFAAQVAV